MEKKYLIIGLISIIFLRCTTDSADSVKNISFLSFNADEGYQTFEVSGDSSVSITCQQGTIITFPAHAFVFEDQTEPKELIKIQVKEIFSPSEMIYNNVTTVSNGRSLESSGMIHITASSEGRMVHLKNGRSYEIRFPAVVSKEDMRLFEGVVEENGINWIPTEAERKDTITIQKEVTKMLGFGAEETTISLMQIIGDDTLFLPYDSLINADTVISNKIDYFIFDGKKFDWINCDRFINEENLVDFNVIIDSAEYFTAYAVLNSYNSVLPIYENNSILKLPRNTMTTIVTLGYKDDKLCYGEEKVEIQDNGSVKVALIEKNSDYIKTRINQL